MIIRVLKVMAYMFLRIFGYAWLRLARARGSQDWLQRQFRGWTDYVLQVFDASTGDVGSRPVSGTSLVVDGLTAGRSYGFVVHAQNATAMRRPTCDTPAAPA